MHRIKASSRRVATAIVMTVVAIAGFLVVYSLSSSGEGAEVRATAPDTSEMPPETEEVSSDADVPPETVADQPAISRSAAETKVRQLSASVPPEAELTSKLTTIDALLDVNADARGIVPLTEKSSRAVWLVSVTGGGFRAQFGGGDTYDWGLLVIDAETGDPLASFAGSDAPEAPYFDDVADAALR